MVASIRYQDTFTKSDGTWLFSERRLYVDWTDSTEDSLDLGALFGPVAV